MTNENLEFFKAYKQKIAAYTLAHSTVYFDITTVAPKAGIPYRNQMLSILAGEAFSFQVDPENLQKLQDLYDDEQCDDDIKKELRLYFREIENVRKLPKDVYIKFVQTISDSETAWLEAKEKDDYQIFKPHLRNVIKMQKEVLTYLDKSCSDYDYLLDQYQEGLNIVTYDEFFKKVKEELLPLIKQIKETGKTIDTTPLQSLFNVQEQEAFMDELNTYMQVNNEECYMSVSEHPFTEFFSAHEARITTHYYEDNLMSAISSTVHEYGHALYSLQVKEEYDGTSFKNGIGFAMHESQSRFMENHIGKSKAFWEANYPALQAHFPTQLGSVSLDDFIRMINISQPSLIRTEADELTYPIHILIRYELEKEFINGSVDYDQLDTLWNDKYEEYLGIRPATARDGILQDMHWGAGNLGYFPTYALGSAYAAQFYHTLEKEMDVAKVLRNKDFKKLSDWLKENIHQYGAYKTADEILFEVTGETFNPTYYIEYLKQKYKTLYELD